MVDTLSPAEVVELLAKLDVDVVDVRDEQEWAAGHLENSRLIPLDTLRADAEALLRHKPILFVCARGVRSLSAAKLAERLGYEQVYSLDGGLNAWKREGLNLARGSAPTLDTAAA